MNEEDEEDEFEDDLLDSSFEVPIDIIEPTFTIEDYNLTFPYLNVKLKI